MTKNVGSVFLVLSLLIFAVIQAFSVASSQEVFIPSLTDELSSPYMIEFDASITPCYSPDDFYGSFEDLHTSADLVVRAIVKEQTNVSNFLIHNIIDVSETLKGELDNCELVIVQIGRLNEIEWNETNLVKGREYLLFLGKQLDQKEGALEEYHILGFNEQGSFFEVDGEIENIDETMKKSAFEFIGNIKSKSRYSEYSENKMSEFAELIKGIVP